MADLEHISREAKELSDMADAIWESEARPIVARKWVHDGWLQGHWEGLDAETTP